MEKLVSVIIPTYGRSKTLIRALNSVRNQTYNNIEIIVVNDNNPGTSNSEFVQDAIKEYGNIKNGIRLINNKQNVGGAEARNIGLKESNGYYISFLDDDDEILPNKIKFQTQLLEEKLEVSLVYCYSKTVFDEEGNKEELYDKNNYKGNCLKELILDGTIAATTQWLCRKEDLLSINGFDNVPSKQDSTLIMKLLEQGKKIDVVPEVLSIYHVQKNNSISTSEKSKEGLLIYKQRCQKHYDLLTRKEIKYVEYKFAEQMYIKNYKYPQKRKEDFSLMRKNRFLYAYYRKMYYTLFFIKNKIL